MSLVTPRQALRSVVNGAWTETLACRRGDLRPRLGEAGPSTLAGTLARRYVGTVSAVQAGRSSALLVSNVPPIPPLVASTHCARPLFRPLSSTPRRTFPPSLASSPTAPAPPVPKPAVNPDAPSAPVSGKSQTTSDWRIIFKLAENIWPRGATATKVRVFGALGLLVAGKVLNVQVPFFFKQIVDSLNVPITEHSTVWVLAGASIAGCERLCFEVQLRKN
jgi:ABC transporter ATM